MLYVCWCICYIDDIVLLAPCPSALRTICSSYASFHRPQFNASMTQFTCWTPSTVDADWDLFNPLILDQKSFLGLQDNDKPASTVTYIVVYEYDAGGHTYMVH